MGPQLQEGLPLTETLLPEGSDFLRALHWQVVTCCPNFLGLSVFPTGNDIPVTKAVF